MSAVTSSVRTETFPSKIGELENDSNVWMRVGCNMESTESKGFKILKFTPQSGMMNFSIWKDANKHATLELEESEWKSFIFTQVNHLSSLESATLSLYEDTAHYEKDITSDLSGDEKTVEYLLPNIAPEGYWNKIGSPKRIKYILIKFYGKSGKLSGSFEISKVHLVRSNAPTLLDVFMDKNAKLSKFLSEVEDAIRGYLAQNSIQCQSSQANSYRAFSSGYSDVDLKVRDNKQSRDNIVTPLLKQALATAHGDRLFALAQPCVKVEVQRQAVAKGFTLTVYLWFPG